MEKEIIDLDEPIKKRELVISMLARLELAEQKAKKFLAEMDKGMMTKEEIEDATTKENILKNKEKCWMCQRTLTESKRDFNKYNKEGNEKYPETRKPVFDGYCTVDRLPPICNVCQEIIELVSYWGNADIIERDIQEAMDEKE